MPDAEVSGVRGQGSGVFGLPAVFGGAFDPFHEGHRQLLLKSADRFQFKPYLIVPSGQPPHKAKAQDSDAQRVALIQKALGPDPRFMISDIELIRPGPHYAIDTLRLLKARYAPQSELVYVQGSDSVQGRRIFLIDDLWETGRSRTGKPLPVS